MSDIIESQVYTNDLAPLSTLSDSQIQLSQAISLKRIADALEVIRDFAVKAPNVAFE